MKTVLGVDVGGTEIKGALVTEDGNRLRECSHSTDADKGFQGVLKAFLHVLDHLMCKEVLAIGVGTAGTVDFASGKVVYATNNLPGWTGFDMAGFLKERYRLPCAVDNDAYAALAGELRFGEGAGKRNVAMVTLGTGVGGAVAIDGRVYRGASGKAGRFGHMILVPGGKSCNCGSKGCAEQYLSGKAFTEGARELGYTISHGREIFDRIAAGDAVLTEYAERYFSYLAALMQSIVNSCDPELILLGGGVVNSAPLWWEPLFLPRVKHLSVVFAPAVLKNTAGIMGSASMAFDLLNHKNME